MKYFLGISAYFHDSSAALILDNKVVAAIQEERLTRIKADSSFPKNSVLWLMNNYNLKLNDLEALVFYEKPLIKFERIIENYINSFPKGLYNFNKNFLSSLKNTLFIKSTIKKEMNKLNLGKLDANRIKFSSHHLSHAAGSYFLSDFKEAAVVVIDGVGEWSTTSIGYAKNNEIHLEKEIRFPNSLGLFYSAITFFLGFKPNSAEYKIMGLAPYGKPIFTKKILKELIEIYDDGSFKIDQTYFNFIYGGSEITKKFENLFETPIRKNENEELKQIHFDIAASAQQIIEIAINRMGLYCSKLFKTKNIVFSGGVALNCTAVSKLENNSNLNIWVQPAAGDCGGSIGSALFYSNLLNFKKTNFNIKNKESVFLGPSYSEEEIINTFTKMNVNFDKMSDDVLIDYVSENLINGNVIGWFEGRMEFGPRALGARSILADPRNKDMKNVINKKIKKRESFRPFAPSVLEEYASKYFHIEEKSEFMTKTFKVKKEFENKLPSVVHIDGTSRIQTVSKFNESKFRKLIVSFYNKTQCPLILNTSFNIRGEPMVCSPEDAINCFFNSGLDLLIIENFIVKKSNNKDFISKFKTRLFPLD